ncbi:DUF6626 family protein [Terasakiella sp.]|uniref:DUF6626 family protein n=1 Tax=Terasakiella sp. TaxID=2034861 RepID=UPI003AA83A18
MIIKTEGMPLSEAIFEFLRSNYFINSSSDLSRQMGRSRCYLSTIRYTNRMPSNEAFSNLHGYLKNCISETDDADLQQCLKQYMRQIEEVLA